ncbi:nucleotide-binding protein, partial [Sphingobacterium hotanense]|uniref:nucleotide-binding protein n=1 Tax=Sphingobacterium hotanense TaxID=649196 RepID=UPI0021A46B33
ATADDITKSRLETSKSPRDNVIFEYGLFTGGIGSSRTFLVMEEGTKLPSDLNGITLPFILKHGDEGYEQSYKDNLAKIQRHIKSKEGTYDLGYLPSTALAYGYFTNFVERTVQRLLEDRKDQKVFILDNNEEFLIKELKVTILIPDDLSDNMFNKVRAKRLLYGWQKMKVDPKEIRDYDFSIDVSKVEDGILHLVDIPLTLNALNKSIELYSKKEHIGKSNKESLLEYREITNFFRTLEYLVQSNSLTKQIVELEIVNI